MGEQRIPATYQIIRDGEVWKRGPGTLVIDGDGHRFEFPLEEQPVLDGGRTYRITWWRDDFVGYRVHLPLR